MIKVETQKVWCRIKKADGSIEDLQTDVYENAKSIYNPPLNKFGPYFLNKTDLETVSKF